jgi:hypothetical protein
MINNDVPPKKVEKPCVTPSFCAIPGKIPTNASNTAPGKVILSIIAPMKSVVGCPGFTPGINPLFCFRLSAICLGLKINAVYKNVNPITTIE